MEPTSAPGPQHAVDATRRDGLCFVAASGPFNSSRAPTSGAYGILLGRTCNVHPVLQAAIRRRVYFLLVTTDRLFV